MFACLLACLFSTLFFVFVNGSAFISPFLKALSQNRSLVVIKSIYSRLSTQLTKAYIILLCLYREDAEPALSAKTESCTLSPMH